MAIIEADVALGRALQPPIKRKANTTGKLRAGPRAQARRVVSGAPEVMVKVTGFGRGAAHVKSHLQYITRNGRLEIENDRGDVFRDKDEIQGLFKDWQQDFIDSKRYKNRRDTVHMILSMPPSTESEAVRVAVQNFAKTTFSQNHEYVFALHTDELHPHCHLTIKSLGFDGKRLNPRKADLQDWRDGFAEALRDQGVNAEATPRRSRGVIRKAKRQVIRHIEHRGVSRVAAAKVQEVVNEISAVAQGKIPKRKPWEEKIKARQAAIRALWMVAAERLLKSETGEDKLLAVGVKDFLTGMPNIDTERHQTTRKLVEKFSRQHDEKRDKDVER